jgi:C4-dicarboxylate-specific signal transduction histidine kinase
MTTITPTTTTVATAVEGGYYSATMTATELVATVAMLRARHQAIVDAHRLLLEYGVETQTAEVLDRLDAIKAEAHEIACRLAALGEHQEAAHAASGWLITTRRTARS